jgi:hypothetical protein
MSQQPCYNQVGAPAIRALSPVIFREAFLTLPQPLLATPKTIQCLFFEFQMTVAH